MDSNPDVEIMTGEEQPTGEFIEVKSSENIGSSGTEECNSGDVRTGEDDDPRPEDDVKNASSSVPEGDIGEVDRESEPSDDNHVSGGGSTTDNCEPDNPASPAASHDDTDRNVENTVDNKDKFDLADTSNDKSSEPQDEKPGKEPSHTDELESTVNANHQFDGVDTNKEVQSSESVNNSTDNSSALEQKTIMEELVSTVADRNDLDDDGIAGKEVVDKSSDVGDASAEEISSEGPDTNEKQQRTVDDNHHSDNVDLNKDGAGDPSEPVNPSAGNKAGEEQTLEEELDKVGMVDDIHQPGGVDNTTSEVADYPDEKRGEKSVPKDEQENMVDAKHPPDGVEENNAIVGNNPSADDKPVGEQSTKEEPENSVDDDNLHRLEGGIDSDKPNEHNDKASEPIKTSAEQKDGEGNKVEDNLASGADAPTVNGDRDCGSAVPDCEGVASDAAVAVEAADADVVAPAPTPVCCDSDGDAAATGGAGHNIVSQLTAVEQTDATIKQERERQKAAFYRQHSDRWYSECEARLYCITPPKKKATTAAEDDDEADDLVPTGGSSSLALPACTDRGATRETVSTAGDTSAAHREADARRPAEADQAQGGDSPSRVVVPADKSGQTRLPSRVELQVVGVRLPPSSDRKHEQHDPAKTTSDDSKASSAPVPVSSSSSRGGGTPATAVVHVASARSWDKFVAAAAGVAGEERPYGARAAADPPPEAPRISEWRYNRPTPVHELAQYVSTDTQPYNDENLSNTSPLRLAWLLTRQMWYLFTHVPYFPVYLFVIGVLFLYDRWRRFCDRWSEWLWGEEADPRPNLMQTRPVGAPDNVKVRRKKGGTCRKCGFRFESTVTVETHHRINIPVNENASSASEQMIEIERAIIEPLMRQRVPPPPPLAEQNQPLQPTAPPPGGVEADNSSSSRRDGGTGGGSRRKRSRSDDPAGQNP